MAELGQESRPSGPRDLILNHDTGLALLCQARVRSFTHVLSWYAVASRQEEADWGFHSDLCDTKVCALKGKHMN